MKILLNPLAPIAVLALILVAILLFTDALSEPVVLMLLGILAVFLWVWIIAMNQDSQARAAARTEPYSPLPNLIPCA